MGKGVGMMSGPERTVFGEREVRADQPAHEPQGVGNMGLAPDRTRDGPIQWEGYDLAILDAVLDT
jgi:hypothetical protein